MLAAAIAIICVAILFDTLFPQRRTAHSVHGARVVDALLIEGCP